MNTRSRAVALVAAAAVMWGTYGSFVTAISSRGMSGNVIVFLRFLATCVPVFLYLYFTDRAKLRIKAKDLPLFLANGLASILFFTACYTAAIRETKIAVAAALLYTSPAMVMLLSAALFRERITWHKIFCVVLSVLGCALVSGLGKGSGGLTLRGLLLGLGSAFGYSLYSIFSRQIQKRGYSALTNVFYTFTVATAAFLALILIDGTASEVLRLPGATGLALLCGLVTGLAAYLAYTTGLEHMEPSRAAQLATVEPVSAALLGAVLFAQRLSLSETAGVALVVIAVVLMNVSAPGKTA